MSSPVMTDGESVFTLQRTFYILKYDSNFGGVFFLFVFVFPLFTKKKKGVYRYSYSELEAVSSVNVSR